MIWGAFGAGRDLPRLHQITSVLIRHGLGEFVRRVGIGTVLERTGQILHWGEASESVHLEPPERIRVALEELGPTFVKLGQVLSTREDLFPPKWIAEFERLQSGVAPVAFGELLPEVEKALGRLPQEVFVDLDTAAYASASIAQVHRARLPNGAPVVLKIRRPGIQATVEADIRILTHIAALLEAEIPEARRYQPTQILAQFSRSLERELDLAVEARNIDRFAKNFAGDLEVLVPRVYWEWTSPVMNVQEYIEAIPGNDLRAIEAAGLDRKLLASRGADTVLRMILVDGFFHADPHPGNVFYLPGNRIVMIDFGMVGRLTHFRRNQIVDLLSGIASRDEEGITEVILDWTGDAYVDEAKLAADMGELVFDYADVPLKDVRIATLLRQVSSIMREHSIVLPRISLSCSRRSSRWRGSGASTIRSSGSSTISGRISSGPSPNAMNPPRSSSAGRTAWHRCSTWSAPSRGTSPGCSRTYAEAECGWTSISSAWTASAGASITPSTASPSAS